MLFCQWTPCVILIFLSSSPHPLLSLRRRRAPITGGTTAFLDLALAWACLCLAALLAAAARILALLGLLGSDAGGGAAALMARAVPKLPSLARVPSWAGEEHAAAAHVHVHARGGGKGQRGGLG